MTFQFKIGQRKYFFKWYASASKVECEEDYKKQGTLIRFRISEALIYLILLLILIIKIFLSKL